MYTKQPIIWLNWARRSLKKTTVIERKICDGQQIVELIEIWSMESVLFLYKIKSVIKKTHC